MDNVLTDQWQYRTDKEKQKRKYIQQMDGKHVDTIGQ